MTQKHPLQGVTYGGWFRYQTLSAGNSFALAPDRGVPGTVRKGPQGFRDETCILASIKLSKGCERLSPSRKFASHSTPNITLHLKDMRAVYARNIRFGPREAGDGEMRQGATGRRQGGGRKTTGWRQEDNRPAFYNIKKFGLFHRVKSRGGSYEYNELTYFFLAACVLHHCEIQFDFQNGCEPTAERPCKCA